MEIVNGQFLYPEFAERMATEALPNTMPTTKLLTHQVCKMLGIRKITLRVWMAKKKIKYTKEKIGDMVYYGFDPDEVRRLQKRLLKRRLPGKPILVPKEKKAA